MSKTPKSRTGFKIDSAFIYGVPKIVSMRTQKQMIWVDTPTVITFVTNYVEHRNWTFEDVP
jgi:putative flippase GtrA